MLTPSTSWWPGVWLVFFLNMVSAILWLSYSPVPDLSKFYFGGVSRLNWMNISFFLSYFPGTVISSYALDIKGIRQTLITGVSLQFFGSILRFFAFFFNETDLTFAFSLAGHAILALGMRASFSLK